ncbi:AAA family ATPase [Otariodibacter oris]|uniref:5-methylcytosine-specific restriction protein B n=1 Tax=Otariodibacter oris TaxID=1032623 RepID=A0A420XFZ1_9PAST|nr:AAA family ATPase [Otariodibacter oris]QGM80350.1 hypothetical protein A6A10_02520 [Otariodibacter oris]RKR71720.1 5-methylcytosine-specific restriction protein B [Otariodibacter oris]
MSVNNEQGYTWIPTFKAIADWLVDYKDRQEELIDILIEIGVGNGLKDVDSDGKKSTLKEIDPFTFIALILKFGDEKRKTFISNLIKKMGIQIPIPKDFYGVPKSQQVNAWLFPSKDQRSDDSIPLLWKFFEQIRNGKIDDDTFDKVLKIKKVGFDKLTQNIFYINPSKYLPIDSQTRPFLISLRLNVPKNNKNEKLANYQRCLDEVRIKTNNKPFWEISYEAWIENQNSKKYKKQVQSPQVNTQMKQNSKSNNTTTIPLNRILYGPPGTGKTYKTTELAVECVDPNWYAKLTQQYPEPEQYSVERRNKLKVRYDELTAEGRIAFTTFHQSFAYEDFIEGIRAEIDEETKQVYYSVEDGVFKRLANASLNETMRERLVDLSKEPNIWKISLGRREEAEFRKACIEAGEARIGWKEVGDLNIDINDKTEAEKKYFYDQSSQNQNSITNFHENIQIGDIIVCLQTRKSIEAVGIVTSDYFYDKNSIDKFSCYPHVRKVNWFLKNVSIDIYSLNHNKLLEIPTCVPLKHLKWSSLLDELERQDYFKDRSALDTSRPRENNYMLIIDEINRGNISRIFGELITLLEPDKRKGGSDAREVTLPYSKEKFSVPSNLYILGTMNTADKSLTQLDLALRRRFEFSELLPNPRLLEGITVHGVDVSELLSTINARIEVLLDREHTIGHSYFWTLKNLEKEEQKEKELANIFEKRIIPLLQEYFFSDWERIGWVLNDSNKQADEKFIQTESLSPKLSELFGSDIEGLVNDRRYKINERAFSKPESYQKILMPHTQLPESSDSQE